MASAGLRLYPGRGSALAGPRRALVPALSQRALLWIAASLLVVTAALNFYLFQVSVVATSAYEVQRLERDRQSWLARNQQLELELAKSRSLAWVEFQAAQQLGMTRAERLLYLPVETAPPGLPGRSRYP